MPIHRTIEPIRPTQTEFGQIAYEVMSCVYGIHNDFGRLFDEVVYKREFANRMAGIELELPVTVTFGSFSKTYKLDVLAHRRGLFEFKAVETITPRHRTQTINYLLLFDLPHAKLINVRPQRVVDEFVNCHLRLKALRNPPVDSTGLESNVAGGSFFYDHIMGLIQDWGSGLETELYEEALTHLLGGEERVVQLVPVIGANGRLHDQKMRLMAPGVAFKLTAFHDQLDAFETNARRFVQHTALSALHWANITHGQVTLRTIR
ncbi:MAG TPA: GxxExxY protein [Pirellulaceae bacterium]|nr:GxxExxY protein [Pirellulaceae bacterium]